MQPERLTPARRFAPDLAGGRGLDLLVLALLAVGALVLPGLLVPLALAVLFVGLLVGVPLAGVRVWQALSGRRLRPRARALLARPTPWG
jgi:hypothetical protein